MKQKFNLKLGVVCAIVIATLAIPALGQTSPAKEKMKAQLKEFRAQMLKELKLPADKEKAFIAVDDKYAAERQKIIADLKKSQGELKAALAAPKPDEAKLKDLVSAATSGQDNLFASFKNQRDDELALLTPAEQGKYLLAMGQWRHKMMEKCMKEEAGKMMKKEKPKKK